MESQKCWDAMLGANRVDPDQTAPVGAVWSGSTLFANIAAAFGHNDMN